MEASQSAMDAAKRKRLTAGILVLIAVYGLTNNFQSVAMNRVVDSFHLTGGSQGIMSSMINVGCMLAMLTAPLLQGRVRKAALLITAALLQTLAFLGLGVTSSYGSMILVSILLGLGFGWLDTSCNSAMVDAHPQNSSFFLGLLHGAFGVGSLISPLLVTALLAALVWQKVSLVMGACCLAGGLVYLFIAPFSFKSDISVKREQPLGAKDILAFLSRKKNLLLLVAGVLYAATQTALTVWLVRYMTLRFQAETLGATALSVYWICATISRFTAPRIRMRPLKLFFWGALLSCLFQAVGVLSGSGVLMCVMVGGVGLVSGQCIPMILGECTAGYEGMTSLPTSVMLFTMCLARILIPVIMGAVCDGVSITAAMLLPVITGLLAALSALGVLKGKFVSAN